MWNISNIYKKVVLTYLQLSFCLDKSDWTAIVLFQGIRLVCFVNCSCTHVLPQPTRRGLCDLSVCHLVSRITKIVMSGFRSNSGVMIGPTKNWLTVVHGSFGLRYGFRITFPFSSPMRNRGFSISISHTVCPIITPKFERNPLITFFSNTAHRSLKVIEISATRKLGYGFLFAFYSNKGRICNRLWYIHCQRMAWPWKPG